MADKNLIVHGNIGNNGLSKGESLIIREIQAKKKVYKGDEVKVCIDQKNAILNIDVWHSKDHNFWTRLGQRLNPKNIESFQIVASVIMAAVISMIAQNFIDSDTKEKIRTALDNTQLLEIKKKQLVRENGVFKNLASRLRADSTDLANDIAKLTISENALKQKVNTLRDSIANLDASNKKQYAQLSALQINLNDVQKSLDKVTSEKEFLKNELRGSTLTNKALVKKLDSATKRIELLEEKLIFAKNGLTRKEKNKLRRDFANDLSERLLIAQRERDKFLESQKFTKRVFGNVDRKALSLAIQNYRLLKQEGLDFVDLDLQILLDYKKKYL